MSVQEMNQAERVAIRHINDRGWDIFGPYGAGSNADRKRIRTYFLEWVHPSERELAASLMEDRVMVFLASERIVAGGSMAWLADGTGPPPIPSGSVVRPERRLLVVKGEEVTGDFRVP